ncbi:hypothetical protein BWQ96_07605 [Gracilariopsis chorda]|uniref:Uncharacterized protein n=1 Tax=Gracilariopsis chorda TaxID=448386 RepID=A0A2V3IKQ6_9FLOR|nr:hypothetical protein BWQ96_07605 [Gracilariopsis chorda]|eukprot:PXF42662.1 hypothetical protein BWQ96_07605 [Gracilariopsis chorda]
MHSIAVRRRSIRVFHLGKHVGNHHSIGAHPPHVALLADRAVSWRRCTRSIVARSARKRPVYHARDEHHVHDVWRALSQTGSSEHALAIRARVVHPAGEHVTRKPLCIRPFVQLGAEYQQRGHIGHSRGAVHYVLIALGASVLDAPRKGRACVRVPAM